MSRQASKSLIGAFVLGALVLVVAGIVIFGSGKLFTKTNKSVMFFEGSVKGLHVGAPVVFHGVEIGHVTDIILEVNKRDLTAFIPVYIEISQQKMVPIGGDHIYDKQFLQDLIKKGLRAQVQLQSFVTGQLMVNLDFYPNTTIRLVGLEKRYPEIPTIPSGLEQLSKRLEELPLKEIADRLNETLAGINRLVQNLNTEIGPLVSDIKGTADAARATFAQAEKTLRFDEGVPGQIGSSIKETLSAAQDTLKNGNEAAKNINVIALKNANFGYEIGRTLEQIAELSRSLRVLADYLERHPEALLRGKSNDKGD